VIVDKPGYTVSGDGVPWTEGDLVDSTGSANITVNAGDEKQDWHGFGGTYNEKGWDALMALSQEDRDRAIRLLFSPTDGAGFVYGRIPIGSSDYGLSRYSLNETSGDFEMTNFSIARDREALIPYIKASMEVNPNIKFWGSPWSPPTWMKDNGQFDRGNMKGDAQTLQAHALYLARFVEEYALEGIDLLAIHPQNEPGYPQDYPSCIWSASVMTDYIGNYLGPTFEERGLTAEIWLGTMSNTSSDSIVTSVMGNAKASGYVRGIGAQWAMRQNIGRYGSTYGVPTMQTEHQCGNNPWEGGYQQQAPNDYAYALEGWNWIVDWLNQGVSSYLAWNMVLDTNGRSLDDVRPWSQNALLIVNRGSSTLNITPTFQMFRHLSQYTTPGGKRVGVTGDAIAFKNPDGSLAVIIHNGGATQTMTVSGNGRTVSVEVPGRGFATVNLD
jgi:glucosylceramidase